MKMLIVEDDENKRTQLATFLSELLPSCEMLIELSLQSGVQHIRRSPPDLIILDMQLPNYDPGPDETGGQMYVFGGREFLRQMDRFEIVIPVIVVTQFETFGQVHKAIDLSELDQQLRREHAPVYVGAVYYNAAIAGWQQQLASMVAAAMGHDLRKTIDNA